jgi:hypothetical protein
METKPYTTIDRAALGWPAGPWDGEPDKVQWPDAATSLPCLAVRNRRRGNWCGYVGVAPDHPLHGKGYSDEGVNLRVHGGITFADSCSPNEKESQGICHTPAPGETDHVWWFGFDCAHAQDYSPQDLKDEAERGYLFTIQSHQRYRSLAYVQQQCAELAGQLVTPNV